VSLGKGRFKPDRFTQILDALKRRRRRSLIPKIAALEARVPRSPVETGV